MPTELKYVGDGAWLPGVPARDISVATVDEPEAVRAAADVVMADGVAVDDLCAHGLYERVAARPSGRPASPAPSGGSDEAASAGSGQE